MKPKGNMAEDPKEDMEMEQDIKEEEMEDEEEDDSSEDDNVDEEEAENEEEQNKAQAYLPGTKSGSNADPSAQKCTS